METNTNWWSYLLDTLLREMINQQKSAARNEVAYCLCTYSVNGMDPRELDTSSMEIKFEDVKRYYVGVSLKKGGHIVVPLEKRLANKRNISLIKFS